MEYFGEAARDTVVYIPLAPEGEDKVSAFFYVVLKGTINIQLYNKYDYEQFGFDTLVTTNSHNLALQFMILDYLSFGHKDFKILDERILKDFNIHPDIPIEDRTVHLDNLEKTDLGRGWEYWSVEICTKTRYLECSSPGRCCSDGSCSGCLGGGCWKTKQDCKRTTIAVYNDGSDSGGGYDPGNGTIPEGGSGGGSAPLPSGPQQCNPTPLFQTVSLLVPKVVVMDGCPL